METPIMAPDGGYLLNGDNFAITRDKYGRPIVNIVGGTGGNVTEHNNDPKAHGPIEMDCGEIL